MAEVTSRALPPETVLFGQAAIVLLGEGVLPPASCTGGQAFEAQYWIVAAALAMWCTSILTRNCGVSFLSKQHVLGSSFFAIAVALYPGSTASALSLVRCVSATMTAKGLAALNGGSVAASAADSSPDHTATVSLLLSSHNYVCWSPSGDHLPAAVIAVVTIAAYVVGLPLVSLLFFARYERVAAPLWRKAGCCSWPCKRTSSTSAETSAGVSVESVVGADVAEVVSVDGVTPVSNNNADDISAANTPAAEGVVPNSVEAAPPLPANPAPISPRPLPHVSHALSLFSPDARYSRLTFDLILLAVLSAARAFAPLPETGSELEAKTGVVCGALCIALLHVVASARQFDPERVWMLWARALVLLVALGCTLQNASARAADLGLGWPASPPTPAAAYALFALCAAVTPLTLLIGVMYAIVAPAPPDSDIDALSKPRVAGDGGYALQRQRWQSSTPLRRSTGGSVVISPLQGASRAHKEGSSEQQPELRALDIEGGRSPPALPTARASVDPALPTTRASVDRTPLPTLLAPFRAPNMSSSARGGVLSRQASIVLQARDNRPALHSSGIAQDAVAPSQLVNHEHAQSASSMGRAPFSYNAVSPGTAAARPLWYSNPLVHGDAAQQLGRQGHSSVLEPPARIQGPSSQLILQPSSSSPFPMVPLSAQAVQQDDEFARGQRIAGTPRFQVPPKHARYLSGASFRPERGLQTSRGRTTVHSSRGTSPLPLRHPSAPSPPAQNTHQASSSNANGAVYSEVRAPSNIRSASTGRRGAAKLPTAFAAALASRRAQTPQAAKNS